MTLKRIIRRGINKLPSFENLKCSVCTRRDRNTTLHKPLNVIRVKGIIQLAKLT